MLRKECYKTAYQICDQSPSWTQIDVVILQISQIHVENPHVYIWRPWLQIGVTDKPWEVDDRHG